MFDDRAKELSALRYSLREIGSYANAIYQRLRPVQQQWLRQGIINGRISCSGVLEKEYLVINPKDFVETACKTIALEIGAWCDEFLGYHISDYSLRQLIRVLNYAHDLGGKRVILINRTDFNARELLADIKFQLPSPEKERTWSRLMLLLCENEDSIFNHENFNLAGAGAGALSLDHIFTDTPRLDRGVSVF